MRDFIFILLFSKTTLLTQQPINLTNITTITAPEKLNVITTGANLSIDISSFLKDNQTTAGLFTSNEIEQLLPVGTFSVWLKNGTEQHQLEKRAYAVSAGNTYLIFHSASLTTDFEFQDIEIMTKVTVDNVQIYWQNFSK